MLFVFTIFAVLSAIVITASFAARRKSHLLENISPKTTNPENFRPLFAPTEAELHLFARAEKAAAAAANEIAAQQRSATEKAEKVFEFQKSWEKSPAARNTAELLKLASETENAQLFSEISENVIRRWRKDDLVNPKNLTARDLADLLDSHFRTLPQQERTSGAIFWLKQQIAILRSQSEES